MIEGRYRIVHSIAEGGMATVYKAVDERLGRTVAIKVMHTQLAQGPHREQFVERFRREANSAAAIANPHIVQVYDTGEYNGLDFLVMEYVHGINLRREMNMQGTFSVRETLRILTETLDGLAAAHRVGVVHRDIKPENILLNDRGHVQITDFGLAKAASQATLSSTGMLLGTAAYLAPEMIEHNQATPQGDLYAVGIMAWEMLSGSVPFESDNPVTLVFKHVHEDVPSVATVCTGIDPSVAAFVSHLTARAVQDRPDDASAAAEELHALAAALSPDDWQYRYHAGATAEERSDATLPAMVGGILTGNGALPPVPPSSSAAAMTSSNAGDASTTAIAPHATQVMDIATNHTQIMNPDAIAAAAHSASNAAAATNATNEAKSSTHRKPLIIVLVVLLVATLAGGGAGWWWFAGPGSYWTVPQPDDVSCTENDTQCSLQGAQWTAYESTLKVAGIPYTAQSDYSDDVPKGAIIDVSISGEKAYVDSRISKRGNQQLTVTVSQGVRMVTIPTDIMDSNTPLANLKQAGFDNIKHDESKDEYSLDTAEGRLLSVSPAPGTTLRHDGEVTVVLSKGPMPVSMPNIVGKTRDEMKATMDELKLTVNITEKFDDKIEAGVVISASQDAGAQLKWGDSVDVVISKGPETTVMPNVVGQQYSAAASQLEQLGFTVKKSAPLGDLTHQVRIQSVKAGDTVRLRDENGNPTVVTLTVV